jgi:cell division protein FtsX
MRIPIVAGDLCRTRAAGAAAPAREAMVNRAFAARYLSAWPQPPVGLHLRMPNAAYAMPSSRIVGIVGDARERGLDREAGPTVYWCDSAPNPTPYFLVRTQADPAAAAQTVRVAARELEPLRAVYEIGPLDERIGNAFAQTRLRTTLLLLFATAALLLTCIGVYGTLSYAVTIRRREVGLRLALGAVRLGVVRQFLLEGLRVVALACVPGVALTLAFTQVLGGMLYGVSPTDPLTLAAVLGVVLAVASCAAAVPALRAARVDAAEVLREG